jgi:hypothetical protein
VKRRALWLTALLISLPLALLFLFSPVLRDFLKVFLLEPLITSYYVSRWYLARFPQLLLWAGLILIASAFFVRGYWRVLRSSGSPSSKASEPSSKSPKGALQKLTREIHAARHRPFYQRRLARRLTGIAVRMIARRKKISIIEARTEFERETWTEDPIILSFFRHRKLRPGFTSGHDFQAQFEATLSFLERYQQGG